MNTDRQNKWRRGFTLIELMVVVTLIGLLAALSTPTLSRSVQRSRAKAAAREVSAALRNARAQVMSRGQAALVIISPQRLGSAGPLIQIYAGCSQAPCTDANNIARSCDTLNVTDTLTQLVGTVNWNVVHPDMVMIGATQIPPMANPSGATTMGISQTSLCISPDGRVQMPNGQPITTTFGPVNKNFVVVMSRNPAVVEPDFRSLLQAFSSSDTNFTALSAMPNPDQTAQVRLNRDLVDMFVIEMSFNGAVEVTQ
jgi:prepilin-type N-terminal cleavage/methylation domain-containing protein